MKARTRYPKQYSIEQFLDTVSIIGASLSRDGEKILFSSNETGIFNVYSVPATGGERKRRITMKKLLVLVAMATLLTVGAVLVAVYLGRGLWPWP